MRLTTESIGGGIGYTRTSLQNFEEEYELVLLTVKVQCPKCGNIWGIRVDDYNSSLDIPEKKFQCTNCNTNSEYGRNRDDKQREEARIG